MFYTIRNILPLETEKRQIIVTSICMAARLRILISIISTVCLFLFMMDRQIKETGYGKTTLDKKRVRTPRCAVLFFCKKVLKPCEICSSYWTKRLSSSPILDTYTILVFLLFVYVHKLPGETFT